MKKISMFLSAVFLVSLVLVSGAMAQDLPLTLIKGSTLVGSDVENSRG